MRPTPTINEIRNAARVYQAVLVTHQQLSTNPADVVRWFHDATLTLETICDDRPDSLMSRLTTTVFEATTQPGTEGLAVALGRLIDACDGTLAGTLVELHPPAAVTSASPVTARAAWIQPSRPTSHSARAR